MRPYGVMGVYLIIYIEKTPPRQHRAAGGWLECLFTSDQTHEAGQTEGECRNIGDCQQGSNQCHKVGDQLGVTCSMETWPMPQPTNRTEPTGGVMLPRHILKISITPN